MKNPEMHSNWRVYSFSTRHSNFKHPDKLGLGPLGEDGNPIINDIKLKRKFKYGTAYFLSYFEHSSCYGFSRILQLQLALNSNGMECELLDY